jgi:hypothetical protein
MAAEEEQQPNSITTVNNEELAADNTTKNRWKCNICNKVFDGWYILNYHKLLEHSKSKRPPIGVA